MTSTIAKVVRKKDHRDRYIGSLFRTSEPVTMIPDRHMRRPEIVEKIRKAMSVVLEIEAYCGKNMLNN